MAEAPDNTSSRWQKAKTKFLSLALRTQIFAAIGAVALIVAIAVGATTIINLGNSDAVAGVTLRFEPTVLTRMPGQQLVVDLLMDTGSGSDYRPVNAVQAVFDIDASRLDLACNGSLDCEDIAVDGAWNFVAQLDRVGNTVTIAVGSNSPVSGSDIPVARLTFGVPDTAPNGEATAVFNAASSAVVEDDGLGTNILETVQNEEWDIDSSIVAGNIQISSGPSEQVDCTVPEVNIRWTTTELSNSNVAYSINSCPGCSYESFVSGGASTVTVNDSTTDHDVNLPGVSPDTLYYYRVLSVSSVDNAGAFSPENTFYTGCGDPPTASLTISNVSAEPSARSVVITWNTNLLSDSSLSVGGQSVSDATYTLSHSLTVSGLSPGQTYTANVSSNDGSTPANGSVVFTTLDEDLSLDANIVLKVRRDRVCNEWLSCASSVLVEDIQGESRDLCFDYTLCSQLDPENNGNCLAPVYPEPGSGAASSYTIVNGDPGSSGIAFAQNLTGYSNVGATWSGFGLVGTDYVDGSVPGLFPVPQMRQVGSSSRVPNGDFETGHAYPWQPNNLEIADVEVVTDRTVLSADFNNVLAIRPKQDGNAGALVSLGSGLRSGAVSVVTGTEVFGSSADDRYQYYVAFDARSSDQNINTLRANFVRCGVNSSGFYSAGEPGQSGDAINISGGWQRAIAGPLTVPRPTGSAAGSEVCLQFFAPDVELTEKVQPIFIDNINIQPVLNVRPGETSIDSHITRTCRQYPTDDAPVCLYFDTATGRELQGWEGYCLLTDPRNERRCIQWAPIELIAGSSPALAAYAQVGFGTGPEDRLPLYYCTESRGNSPYIRTIEAIPSQNPPNSTDDVDPLQVRLMFKYDGYVDLPVVGRIYTYAPSGWTKLSYLYNFDNITDKETGNTLSTYQNNSDPLYIYDIEQIVIEPTQVKGKNEPEEAIVLSHANNFEAVWCGGEHSACPENTNLFKDPNYEYYWRDVVDNYALCQHMPNDGTENGDDGTGSGTNLFGAQVIFDDNGALQGIEAGYCDDTSETGWFVSELTVHLREWCTEVAQVVDMFGQNKAWTQRTHSNTYQVPGLGYTIDRDTRPFGGIVAPEPDYDPAQWDYSDEERGRQPLMIEPPDTARFPSKPYQARASSPYGGGSPPGVQAGTEEQGLCDITGSECSLTNPCPAVPQNCVPRGIGGSECSITGDSCYNFCQPVQQDCVISGSGAGDDEDPRTVGRAVCISGSLDRLGSACGKSGDCGYSNTGAPGRCTGVVPPSTVIDEDTFIDELERVNGYNRLSNLFAKSIRIWDWDYVLRRYSISGDRWDITGNPDLATPPKVENVRLSGGFGSAVGPDTGGDIEFDQDFGKVTLRFNSIVDPEQVPLVRYTVDWGDGHVSEESNLKIAPQVSQPHVLTHTYVRRGDGLGCDGSGCTFTPKVQIEDNWGWCSGEGANYGGANAPCNSWNFVTNEFNGIVNDQVSVVFGAGSVGDVPQAVIDLYEPGSLPPYSSTINVQAGDTVTLDASRSNDPDGTIVSYQWALNSAGATIPVPGASPVTSYTFDSVGIYQVVLTIEDNDGNPDIYTGTVNVTVAPYASTGYCRGTSVFSPCSATNPCNPGYICSFTHTFEGEEYWNCSLPSECTNGADCNLGGSTQYNQKCYEYRCTISNNLCQPGVYPDTQGSCSPGEGNCEITVPLL